MVLALLREFVEPRFGALTSRARSAHDFNAGLGGGVTMIAGWLLALVGRIASRGGRRDKETAVLS